MSKFQIIVADPAWFFFDRLIMSDVKRGAQSQYSVLDNEIIQNLPIQEIADDNAILALWVPSSLLQEGLNFFKNAGFKQTQTVIWVKTKKEPLKYLIENFSNRLKTLTITPSILTTIIPNLKFAIDSFSLHNILAFGMGRLFRQTHELVLLGVRGKKIYSYLKNKSQRSVFFGPVTKHSEKPEALQDSLDLMFPDFTKKVELFARRQRKGYLCLGFDSPMTLKEDIRISLRKLILATEKDLAPIFEIVNHYQDNKASELFELWNKLPYENSASQS